jgi:hypothetical protein
MKLIFLSRVYFSSSFSGFQISALTVLICLGLKENQLENFENYKQVLASDKRHVRFLNKSHIFNEGNLMRKNF